VLKCHVKRAEKVGKEGTLFRNRRPEKGKDEGKRGTRDGKEKA